MSIFTNRIIQKAYQKVYQKKLLESRQFIYESAIDKNIHRADKLADEIARQAFPFHYGEIIRNREGEIQYYESKKEKRFNAEYIKHTVKQLMPLSTSEKIKAKFFLGSTRILGEIIFLQRDNQNFMDNVSEFNKILSVITYDDTHVKEYDNNLNGKTLGELKELFRQEIKSVSDKRKAALKAKTYTKNNRYTIIPCEKWEDLFPYGEPLTTWCVAQRTGKNAYDSYTNGGRGKFYVCLRDDYKTVEKTVGPNAPLDDYGLSMIAINVREDGELNTCNVRWNHEHGGSDNVMTVEEISDLLGMNFYEVFKPRDAREEFEKLTYNKHDPFCLKLGFRVGNDGYYYNIEDNNIIKYVHCYGYNISGLVCFANKHFVWFDMKTGHKTEPPETIKGDFRCAISPDLTSLEGSPTIVNGDFECVNCNNLASLQGGPKEVSGSFTCEHCANLRSLYKAPEKIGLDFSCKWCEQLSSLEGVPEIINGSFICCYNRFETLEGAPREVKGDFDCTFSDITSLKGAPEKVGRNFYTYKCDNLASLEGAPRYVGGNFSCYGCMNLASLKGSPRIVGGYFDCSECMLLESLAGSPEKVGRDFNCKKCGNLSTLDGKPRYIGGEFITDSSKNSKY